MNTVRDEAEMNKVGTTNDGKRLALQCVGFALIAVGFAIMIASIIYGDGTRVSVTKLLSTQISPMTELAGCLGMLVGLLGAFLVFMGSHGKPDGRP